MLYLLEENPRLGIWKLEETEEELIEALPCKTTYLPQLAPMRSPQRRREWLATRLLLQAMLEEETPIAYRDNGAPCLPGHPDLAISISHTRGYAAILLQPGRAGIDIEYRSERVCRIQSHFLSDEEIRLLAPARRTEQLLVAWCAKETLFKLLGEHEVDFRRHLHLPPFAVAESGLLEAWETRTTAQQSFRLAYRLFPDFVLVYSETVCPSLTGEANV